MGGGRLEAVGGGDLACTAGFAVSAPSRGLLTASHCANSLTHENESGDPEVATTHKGDHEGEWGDFQWYTTGEWESDDFYYDVGFRRDAAVVGAPVEGQTLCRFGHKTGKQCDEVYKLNQSKGVLEHLTAMHNREADAGDSGGPWFYGTTIYGIHHGGQWIWFKHRDLFSPLIYADDALGVTVATS